MAVHIKLIKNNIKRNSSYGKYFAKSVSQGEVTLDEIAAEACRNSGFSEGAVVGVVTFPASRPPHPGPPHPLRLQRWCQSRLAKRLQAVVTYSSIGAIFHHRRQTVQVLSSF